MSAPKFPWYATLWIVKTVGAAVQRGVVPVEGLQVDGQQPGLPVVGVEHVGPLAAAAEVLEDRAREEREAQPVVGVVLVAVAVGERAARRTAGAPRTPRRGPCRATVGRSPRCGARRPRARGPSPRTRPRGTGSSRSAAGTRSPGGPASPAPSAARPTRRPGRRSSRTATISEVAKAMCSRSGIGAGG